MEGQSNSKDVGKSLNNYADGISKGTNILLDGANQINRWFAEQLDKISDGEVPDSRLETNVENTILADEIEDNNLISKIETKVEEYNEIQTDTFKNTINLNNTNRLKTQIISNEDELTDEISLNEESVTQDGYSVKTINSLNTKVNNEPKKVSTPIKVAKFINNTTNKILKTGRALNTAMNEGGFKSFENSSSKIMTKPIKKVTNKFTSKATEAVKVLTSMMPSIASIIIIIIIIAAVGDFFNVKDTDELDEIKFEDISSMIIEIEDEKLQAIYNEYLKNKGKPYLMDHSNLSYDECMDYYDCSSFVIHCLAHTGIKTIPNTGALGLYDVYCVPVEESNRQAGDLIFLKDTYDTGNPGSISHVGIYMGELTINEETAEWVIDTGGNPEGVKIRKYNNGWWNGEHFYGFGRLKL